MLNVGKLNDSYRLLQTLLNVSALENQQQNPEEVIDTNNTVQNLNSILDDDNAIE